LDGESGEVLWDQHYASIEGVDESVDAVAVDSQGNAYAAGRAFVSGRGTEIITLKLDAADGHVVWAELSGGSDHLDDRAWDIAVGPDDHPVVTGFYSNADGSADYITIKLDKDSHVYLWDTLLPGAVNNESRGGWLAVADDGDLWMGNRTWAGAASYDVVLHRYAAASGDTLWTRQYDGGGPDDPRAMIRDDAGDLLVVGVQSGDFMVLKFAGDDGHLAWHSNYDGPPGWYDLATCVAIGPRGEVVASGYSDGSGTGWDVTTVGFDPDDGGQAWVVRYDGPDNQSDEGRALAVSSQGDIYVVGYCYTYATNMDLVALRYFEDTTDLSGVAAIPAAPHLVAAWPNPFNPRVELALELPTAAVVWVAIHDLQGRRLVLLQDGLLAAGSHTVVWNGRGADGLPVASGVYIARLETGGRTESRKLVLAK
jgi:hypothetical protein